MTDRPESPTRRALPPLNALRVFDAAARTESFRQAAIELCVSHSAVSHQIKELEAALGTPLFERKGRGIVLSDAGSLLFPVIRDAFDRIREGTALVQSTKFQTDLHLLMYVTFAVRWLIPRLHRFTDANPDLMVRLTTSRLRWDFDPDQADLGVVYDPDAGSGNTNAVRFKEAALFPVCSPRYLEVHPDLTTPNDLADHVWLRVYTAENDDWTAWLNAQNLGDLSGKGGVQFDSYLLAFEAAIDGQGIAMAVDFLVDPDIRSGALIPLFDRPAKQPGAWKVTWRHRRHQHPGIKRFCDWLISET